MIENFMIFLREFLETIGLTGISQDYVIESIYAVTGVILAVVLYLILRVIMYTIIKKLSSKSKKVWIQEFVKSPIILSTIKIVPVLILIRLVEYTPLLGELFGVILMVYLTFAAVKIVNSTLDLINILYDKHNSKSGIKPIKGVITFIKILVFLVATIILLSEILGESPIYILTGLGAMSAVTMLIFKDSILGLVAGFQITVNDLIRIGDWIEMPKYGVDGEVLDVTLTFVQVQNWDKTIVTVPAYHLVSESFVNWRNVFKENARRIKRSINIDVNSVKFLDNKEIKDLKNIQLIQKYLVEKELEIKEHNKEAGINTEIPVNGRHLTNLGVFRIYITEYLKNNKTVHQDYPLMVRQLQSTNNGIPLEIYAFSNDSRWIHFERLSSDIFDHIFASIEFFGLRVFQSPTGHDLKDVTIK